jgi:hypothetical protein
MSDPQPTPPAYDQETQAALRRLSQVVWRCLVRLDEHERRLQSREAARHQALVDNAAE